MARVRVENTFDPSQSREIEVDNPNMRCGDFVASKGLVPMNIADQFDVYDIMANRVTDEPIGRFAGGKPITVGPKSVP